MDLVDSGPPVPGMVGPKSFSKLCNNQCMQCKEGHDLFLKIFSGNEALIVQLFMKEDLADSGPPIPGMVGPASLSASLLFRPNNRCTQYK